MLLGNVGHVHPDYPRRRSTGAGADQGDDRGGRQDGAEDLAARAEAEGGAVEDQHQTGEDPGAGQAAEAGTAPGAGEIGAAAAAEEAGEHLVGSALLGQVQPGLAGSLVDQQQPAGGRRPPGGRGHAGGALADRRDPQGAVPRRSRPSCRTAAPTSTASMPKCRKARGESGRPSTRSRSGRPAGVFTGAPRWGSPDPSGRSCLRAAPRRSLAGPVAVIAVEDDAQAVQGQPGVVALDGLADADHHRGQAAGGDHGRVVAQLGDHPPDQRVDLPGEAEDDARLERLRGVLADHRARRDQLDPAELGGLADQRVGGDLDPRRDRHPQHLAPPRDRVEGGGGAEIDHHRRPPVQRVGGHRVGHPVGADLARVVGQDLQARPDPGLQHQRLEAAVSSGHVDHGLAEPRHHRGDDHAGGGGAEVHTLLRQEPAEQQGVLVGGALRHGRHPPVLDQLVAVEHADGDLGVADVQCQQHGGSSYQSRPTSSEGAEWVRPPIDRKSTPVAATWRALARVIPPDASVRARPAAMATALDIMSRSMLSSSSSSQSTSSAWATSSRVSTSTSSGRPGPALRAAATAAASPPAVRMWLSLTRRASPRLMRWFWPPPARTAYLASWRSPGSVLRVSRITAPVPSTAATNAAVSVATPERWPSRLSSVRSAASTTLAGPATWPSSPPAATRRPSWSSGRKVAG